MAPSPRVFAAPRLPIGLCLSLCLALCLSPFAVSLAAAHLGCPACGSVGAGRKISTVHPGEPAVVLPSVPSAEACKALCADASPDLLFFQYSTSKEGESTCFCLATCYSVSEAAPEESSVIGSLCRDLPCPAACGTHPTPNLMFIGSPAAVISRPFMWAPLFGNGTFPLHANGTFPLHANGTFLFQGEEGELLESNGTANGTGAFAPFYFLGNGTVAPSNSSNSSASGNGTLGGLAALGMSFEECRALAASHVLPLTPFFTHLEAMSTCLLFDKCVGVAPAGTDTANSASFCVPTLLQPVESADEETGLSQA